MGPKPPMTERVNSLKYAGEVWSANAQCQIFLLDSDAHIDHRDSDFQVGERERYG